LFILALSPFGLRTSVIPAGGATKQGPEQRLKVRKALEVHANIILVSIQGYGTTSREKWANK
jgi:hypothetical protein